MKDVAEDINKDGDNVKNIRRVIGVSQVDLAEKLGINPTQLNRLERQQTIEDEILDQIAAELGVTAEFIRKYNYEETVNNIISNNVFNDDSGIGSNENRGGAANNNKGNNGLNNTVNNPLDTVKELYDKLLTEKDERIALLEKEIRELKKK